MSALDFMVLSAIALGIALLVVWLTAMVIPTTDRPAAPQSGGTTRHFLFRDDTLLDTDAPEFVLPDPVETDESDWSRFRRWLSPRFPVPRLAEGADAARLDAPGDDSGQLLITRHDNTLHIALSDSAYCAVLRHDLHARLHVAETRCEALAAAPQPVWQRGADGQIIWENSAAAALPETDRTRLLAASAPGRIAIETPMRWYDLTILPNENGSTLYATDVTSIVLAEHARLDVVQNLGRTFADLPTGLAVFDRSRMLVMFNPALIDLTGLDPAFLSGQVDIFAFFDTLRNRQAMPEPKKFADWRNKIETMIRAADLGQYQEVWSLASGQTYRITGRPHPDGAVAFLFEDISDEVAATRDQRSALGLRQAALDRMEEGVAVLSHDGSLLFCNRRFATLAGFGPEPRAGLPFPDLLAACKNRFPNETLWKGVESRIATRGEPALRSRAALELGADLTVRLLPLGQGQVMLALHVDTSRADHTALSA